MGGHPGGEQQRDRVVLCPPVAGRDLGDGVLREPVALDEGQPGEREADRQGEQHGDGKARGAQVAAAAEHRDRGDRRHPEGDVNVAAEGRAGEPGPESRHRGTAGTREQQPEDGGGPEVAAAGDDADQRDAWRGGDDGGADVHRAGRQCRGGDAGPGQADPGCLPDQQRGDDRRGRPCPRPACRGRPGPFLARRRPAQRLPRRAAPGAGTRTGAAAAQSACWRPSRGSYWPGLA